MGEVEAKAANHGSSYAGSGAAGKLSRETAETSPAGSVGVSEGSGNASGSGNGTDKPGPGSIASATLTAARTARSARGDGAAATVQPVGDAQCIT